MSNKLNDTNAVVTFQADGVEVKLSPSIVKNFLTGGAELSDPEYKFFVELCKVRQLNPFLKEAYPIKFGNQPAQIVVGKDAILKRAIKHQKYNGREQGIIVINLKGEVEERKGTFKLADETLVGGWARVFRKDWEHPTYISVAFDEVAQLKNLYETGSDGKSVFVGKELNSNWATKGATMVEKVALVRALRETFVEDLGGMIDADEAWTETKPKQDIIQQNEPDESNVIDVESTEKQVSMEDLD